MRLLQFTADTDEYTISGDVKLTSLNRTLGLKDAIFSNLKMAKNKEAFVPSEIKFSGVQCTCEDAAYDVLCAMTRNEVDQYMVHFIAPKLQSVADAYLKDCISVSGRNIPRYVLHNHGIKTLQLVTREYAYYASEGDEFNMLMVRTQNGQVVSDNYFAANDFEEAFEAVQNGEKSALFDISTESEVN